MFRIALTNSLKRNRIPADILQLAKGHCVKTIIDKRQLSSKCSGSSAKRCSKCQRIIRYIFGNVDPSYPEIKIYDQRAIDPTQTICRRCPKCNRVINYVPQRVSVYSDFAINPSTYIAIRQQNISKATEQVKSNKSEVIMSHYKCSTCNQSYSDIHAEEKIKAVKRDSSIKVGLKSRSMSLDSFMQKSRTLDKLQNNTESSIPLELKNSKSPITQEFSEDAISKSKCEICSQNIADVGVAEKNKFIVTRNQSSKRESNSITTLFTTPSKRGHPKPPPDIPIEETKHNNLQKTMPQGSKYSSYKGIVKEHKTNPEENPTKHVHVMPKQENIKHKTKIITEALSVAKEHKEIKSSPEKSPKENFYSLPIQEIIKNDTASEPSISELVKKRRNLDLNLKTQKSKEITSNINKIHPNLSKDPKKCHTINSQSNLLDPSTSKISSLSKDCNKSFHGPVNNINSDNKTVFKEESPTYNVPNCGKDNDGNSYVTYVNEPTSLEITQPAPIPKCEVVGNFRKDCSSCLFDNIKKRTDDLNTAAQTNYEDFTNSKVINENVKPNVLSGQSEIADCKDCYNTEEINRNELTLTNFDDHKDKLNNNVGKNIIVPSELNRNELFLTNTSVSKDLTIWKTIENAKGKPHIIGYDDFYESQQKVNFTLQQINLDNVNQYNNTSVFNTPTQTHYEDNTNPKVMNINVNANVFPGQCEVNNCKDFCNTDEIYRNELTLTNFAELEYAKGKSQISGYDNIGENQQRVDLTRRQLSEDNVNKRSKSTPVSNTSAQTNYKEITNFNVLYQNVEANVFNGQSDIADCKDFYKTNEIHRNDLTLTNFAEHEYAKGQSQIFVYDDIYGNQQRVELTLQQVSADNVNQCSKNNDFYVDNLQDTKEIIRNELTLENILLSEDLEGRKVVSNTVYSTKKGQQKKDLEFNIDKKENLELLSNGDTKPTKLLIVETKMKDQKNSSDLIKEIKTATSEESKRQMVASGTQNISKAMGIDQKQPQFITFHERTTTKCNVEQMRKKTNPIELKTKTINNFSSKSKCSKLVSEFNIDKKENSELLSKSDTKPTKLLIVETKIKDQKKPGEKKIKEPKITTSKESKRRLVASKKNISEAIRIDKKQPQNTKFLERTMTKCNIEQMRKKPNETKIKTIKDFSSKSKCSKLFSNQIKHKPIVETVCRNSNKKCALTFNNTAIDLKQNMKGAISASVKTVDDLTSTKDGTKNKKLLEEPTIDKPKPIRSRIDNHFKNNKASHLRANLHNTLEVKETLPKSPNLSPTHSIMSSKEKRKDMKAVQNDFKTDHTDATSNIARKSNKNRNYNGLGNLSNKNGDISKNKLYRTQSTQKKTDNISINKSYRTQSPQKQTEGLQIQTSNTNNDKSENHSNIAHISVPNYQRDYFKSKENQRHRTNECTNNKVRLNELKIDNEMLVKNKKQLMKQQPSGVFKKSSSRIATEDQYTKEIILKSIKCSKSVKQVPKAKRQLIIQPRVLKTGYEEFLARFQEHTPKSQKVKVHSPQSDVFISRPTTFNYNSNNINKPIPILKNLQDDTTKSQRATVTLENAPLSVLLQRIRDLNKQRALHQINNDFNLLTVSNNSVRKYNTNTTTSLLELVNQIRMRNLVNMRGNVKLNKIAKNTVSPSLSQKKTLAKAKETSRSRLLCQIKLPPRSVGSCKGSSMTETASKNPATVSFEINVSQSAMPSKIPGDIQLFPNPNKPLFKKDSTPHAIVENERRASDTASALNVSADQVKNVVDTISKAPEDPSKSRTFSNNVSMTLIVKTKQTKFLQPLALPSKSSFTRNCPIEKNTTADAKTNSQLNSSNTTGGNDDDYPCGPARCPAPPPCKCLTETTKRKPFRGVPPCHKCPNYPTTNRPCPDYPKHPEPPMCPPHKGFK